MCIAEDTKVEQRNITTIYKDNLNVYTSIQYKTSLYIKRVKMPRCMVWVQRSSGLVKVEGSASSFKRVYHD